MGSLLLLTGNDERRLPEQDAHYVWIDESRLMASPNPPSRDLCLGYFVSEFGTWWFHPGPAQCPPELRINGRPVHGDVELPSERAELRLTDEPYTDTAPAERRVRPPSTVVTEPSTSAPQSARQMIIGPVGTDADIEIDHPAIRTRHARVEPDARGNWWVIADNGPVSVDGEPVDSALCPVDTSFSLGPCVVVVPNLTERKPGSGNGRALAVECAGVSARRAGHVVLDRVSFVVPAGSFAVVTGPNEAGARLLLGIIGGGYRRESGDVLVGGSSRRGDPRIRWVRETEDFYDTLTVRETLRFAVPPGEPDRAAGTVAQVLSHLGLDAKADRQVRTLSDAERKRLAMAQEIVARPGLLVVFASATSFDVGRDEDLMSRLRTVVRDLDCTVVVATRATVNLDRADLVVVLGRDGTVRHAGPPGRRRTDQSGATWAEWIANLDQPDADRALGRADAPVPLPPLSSPHVPDGLFAHAAAATHRQAVTFLRRGPGLLGLQVTVPIIATAVTTLVTDRPAPLVVVSMAAAGALGDIDVLTARRRMIRDRAAGFGTGAILAARAVVHGAACATLAVPMATVAHLAGVPVGTTAGWSTMWAALTLTMLGSLATGTAACAAVRPAEGTGEPALARNRLNGVVTTACALLPAALLVLVAWSLGVPWLFGFLVLWCAATGTLVGFVLEHRLAAE